MTHIKGGFSSYRSWRSCVARAAGAIALPSLFIAVIVGCKAPPPKPIASDAPIAGSANASGSLDARLDVIQQQAETIEGESNEAPKTTIIQQAEAGKVDVDRLDAELASLAKQLKARDEQHAKLETRLATIEDSTAYQAGEWVKRQFAWIAIMAALVLKWSFYIFVASAVLRGVGAVVPGPWGRVMAIIGHVGIGIVTGGMSLPLTVGDWLWQFLSGRRAKKTTEVNQ